MKLLIAYDGSPCSEAALDDLEFAGLPRIGEANVISVAEVWLPPPELRHSGDRNGNAYVDQIVQKHLQKDERVLNQANILSKHAVKRLEKKLPAWTFTAAGTYGSPAWEILAKARELEPDLIVLGAQGHSVLGRLILGSVSQKVLVESRTSVRIARERSQIDHGNPQRLIVGFDGSPGAVAAVKAIAVRVWPKGTEARIIIATDPPSIGIGRFLEPQNADPNELAKEYSWLKKPLDSAKELLVAAGLIVSTHIMQGNPNSEIVRAAETCHADCIFVGANFEGSQVAGLMLGSTSLAIAARATCSVEIVRD